MTQESKRLQENDIVWIETENDPFVIKYKTFRAGEFVTELGQQCENIEDSSDDRTRHSWFCEGMDCQVLIPNKPWQKGKVRICLEFIPEVEEDEPENKEDIEKIEPEASPLDEIRKMAKEENQ